MDNIYDGVPPANYTCHRCGEKGHFLQACPTNLDPSYDRAPPADYVCEICELQGTHWKSLCPHNYDPYAIITKRRKLGIVTPSHGGLSKPRGKRERVSEGERRMFEGEERNGEERNEKRGRESYDEEREREWGARKRVRGELRLERELERERECIERERTERSRQHGRLSAPRELFDEGEDKMDFIDNSPSADSSARNSSRNTLELQRDLVQEHSNFTGGNQRNHLEKFISEAQQAGQEYIETMTAPDKRMSKQDDKLVKSKLSNRIDYDGTSLPMRTRGVGQGRSGASKFEAEGFSRMTLDNNKTVQTGGKGQQHPQNTKNHNEIIISDSDDEMIEVDLFAVREGNGRDAKKDEYQKLDWFMQEMIKRHPRMMERVNEPPKRKTALDMWTDMEQ